MSSILTNSSSMVALQTLRGINSNLMKTQDEISTGKSVASAKDNSAVWAISKVMEADVKGFKGISASLSLGESTVTVARQAAETVTDLLTEIKGKIVAAQEDNVDRAKIQTDIGVLRSQINTVVGGSGPPLLLVHKILPAFRMAPGHNDSLGFGEWLRERLSAGEVPAYATPF